MLRCWEVAHVESVLLEVGLQKHHMTVLCLRGEMVEEGLELLARRMPCLHSRKSPSLTRGKLQGDRAARTRREVSQHILPYMYVAL